RTRTASNRTEGVTMSEAVQPDRDERPGRKTSGLLSGLLSGRAPSGGALSGHAHSDHLPSGHPLSSRARLTTVLLALCCISVGVAIGAMVREIGARSDDNRLTVSTTPVTPDALSAAFARVSNQVEPSVVHIKVAEDEFSSREGLGSGVIVNEGGYILTN